MISVAMKFIILHGTGASPESNWFRWLEGELGKGGHTVWLPQLPGADEPNEKTYTDFLLGPEAPFAIDAETILVGHSSGAVEILKLLQVLEGNISVASSILVSAFKNNLEWDALIGLFNQPFDFENIKQHCRRFVFVHSDDDPYVPLEHAQYLSEKTDGELRILKGQGHFNIEKSEDYAQFPYLLNMINELMSSF